VSPTDLGLDSGYHGDVLLEVRWYKDDVTDYVSTTVSITVET
jgi:hypothetical protein